MKHFNVIYPTPSFRWARYRITKKFLEDSHETTPVNWQGIDVSQRPEARMRELLNVSFSVDMRGQHDLDHWRLDTGANLPWADDHFVERVCGQPINPGVEWANWPWGDSADRFRDADGRFNHNYMERYWPKYAGNDPNGQGEYNTVGADKNYGIRHEYGDLNDLVSLLLKDPETRQAWIPIFFPEDTGIADGGRKPCSLGYHFMVRDKRLHVYYPLRSCDFVRHWGDDVYLTVRLALWVLEQCRERSTSDYWGGVHLGSFTMHCTSLHMFVNDHIQLRSSQS